jgi:3'(2'), 5'-bisphosphate nucleotidase
MYDDLIQIVRLACTEILRIYDSPFTVETKSDNSPLTQADLRAHRAIEAGLRDIDSSIPIISEESAIPPYPIRRDWERYWLVDPLDGTREFVNRNGEFTVNIALIENHRSILGLVGVPVGDRIYIGDVEENQAFCIEGNDRRTIQTRPLPGDSITVVVSRSHGGRRLQRYLHLVETEFGVVERKSLGSSLKFCLMADGEADFYPRLGPTSEWDIAAAQAVLVAAGGEVCLFDGAPMLYNKKAELLNSDFMAISDRRVSWMDRLPPLPE